MTEKTPGRWHKSRIEKGEVVGGGFIVFRRGQTTGRIKVNPSMLPFEHETYEKASAEALRLSAKTPGIEFCVFRQVFSFREPLAFEVKPVDAVEAV